MKSCATNAMKIGNVGDTSFTSRFGFDKTGKISSEAPRIQSQPRGRNGNNVGTWRLVLPGTYYEKIGMAMQDKQVSTRTPEHNSAIIIYIADLRR